MQIHFRRADSQLRWAWTDGLQALGQREIAVMVSWQENDPRDKLLTELLRFIESYLISQAAHILPNQTLRYGWTTLRFVSDELQLGGAGPNTLLIEENQRPFSPDNSSYAPGVARTLTLLQLQHEVMRRNRISGDAIYPSSSQRALVCSRVTPETIQHLRPLMAHRAWQPAQRESGWFLSCCDQTHNHDHPDELAAIHLLHLVKRFPGLFPYLAMPVGSQLLFEQQQAIIFQPNQEYGQADPEKLLSTLPF